MTSKQQSFDFIKTIGEVRNGVIDRYGCNPSWIKITTITITSKFNHDVSYDIIREYFSKNEEMSVRTRNSTYRFVWRMAATEFYNQVSLYCDDHRSRKSVKLFPNGSVQITGCSDVIDCERVTKQVACVVSHITKKKYELSGYNIHMINSNFSLNYYVNLEEIFNTFTRNGHDTTFNPDRYSAVKIKLEVPGGSKVTTSVFGSGKIIVTGAKELEQVSAAYNSIMETIFSNKEILLEKSEKIELFDRWRGSNIQEWLEKLSPTTIKQ